MKKFSVTEIKRILPKNFIDSLSQNYDSHTVDKILCGISIPKKTTCRINTLKSDFKEVSEYLRDNNIKYKRVEWYKDALILESNRGEIEETKVYQEGKIYLQSLSSMIPPLVLDPKENEKVLDIAAAPGSKTTQIASFMKNSGLIVAYEVNPIRYQKLMYSINLQGVSNVEVILDRGENVKDKYINFFDRVLVDAPCSGEGKFRISDYKTFKAWSKDLVRNSVKVQKKLLAAGIESAKKGGVIVYSTCTLNREENEDIIEWVLDNFQVELVNIEIKDFNLPKLDTIKGCIKVYQSQISEGFFVSKMVKK